MLFLLIVVFVVVYAMVEGFDLVDKVVHLFFGAVISGVAALTLSLIITLFPLHVETSTMYRFNGFAPTRDGNLAFVLTDGSVYVHSKSDVLYPADADGQRVIENVGFYSSVLLVPWTINDKEYEVYIGPAIIGLPPIVEQLPKFNARRR